VKVLFGLWLRLSYEAHYHYLFRISLRSWLWTVVLFPLGAAAIGRMSWSLAIAVSALALLLWFLSEGARYRGYVVFAPGLEGAISSSTPPLAVDEPLACRASGTFAVGRNERAMLNEPARVFYVRTREHVVQVRLQPSRFLLLAPSLPGEEGYWYAFFQPSSVEQVQAGHVRRGFRWDPALAIAYRSQENGGQRQTLYLAFSDLASLQRVLAELRVDLTEEALA
jgi:hypothetical protein